MSLAGKTAVVTGATRNIGLSIAEYLGRKGVRVVVSGPTREEVERAMAALPQLESTGIAADLSSPEGCRHLVARTVSSYGGIDILVNNAALLGRNSHLDGFDLEEWDRIMNVNVRAVLYLSSLALEHMQTGSSIINISSPGARRAHEGRLVYDVSKGALEAATRSMARELGPRGIRVNAVIPGSVRTDRWEGLSPAELEDRRTGIPLRREVECRDVAAAVAFLAADEAKAITGAFLCVDAGVSATT